MPGRESPKTRNSPEAGLPSVAPDAESSEVARRRAQSSELAKTRQSLHEEAAHTYEKSIEAIRRLAELRAHRQMDRAFRLATLNLIEDAEEARQHSERATAERKRAQETLAGSEERFRLMIENAREYAIFSMDLERRITTWNQGAQRILGFSEKEILGQSGDVIFTLEDRKAGAPQREAKTALEQGRASDERWHLHKNGSRFWSSGVMMAMYGAKGAAVGFVKVLRDQTDAKKVEEELSRSRWELERALQETERARQEADRANRIKDSFFATLSHELRTPLTPVMMAVESLLLRKDLPERVREGLEMIHRNIDIETRFVDDLLDITRISHGKLQLASDLLDLHDATRRAVEVSQSDLSQKEQELTLELAAEQSTVRGDAARLQQVFWNVVKNASKFTPARGQIRIASRNEPGDWIAVEISDTGAGIDPARLDDIFEAFRQEDTSIVRKYGGLGLGLAIARAAIEGHGGTITAASEGRGKGAIFTVRLPLAR